MTKIDTVVDEYYQSQELSDESLNRILLAGKEAHFAKRRRTISAVAALFIFSILSVFTFLQVQKNSIINGAVGEIAKNHNKNESSKIISADYGEISSQLSELSFAFHQPEGLKEYTLLGGKYCSVREERAAQLKVKNSDGVILTVYIVRNRGSLTKIPEMSYEVNETTVRFWREGELLYALAE